MGACHTAPLERERMGARHTAPLERECMGMSLAPILYANQRRCLAGVLQNAANAVVDRDQNASMDNLIKLGQNALGRPTITGAHAYVLCATGLGAAATAGGGFFASTEWKEDI